MDTLRRRSFLGTVSALVFVWGACTTVQVPTTKIKIGERMPDFTLRDPGGNPHSLSEFKGKKAVVVIFIATRCPYSNAFNGVMGKLAREYTDRSVVFVGINSNRTEPVAEVAAHAQANGFGFLVLKDEESVVAMIDGGN